LWLVDTWTRVSGRERKEPPRTSESDLAIHAFVACLDSPVFPKGSRSDRTAFDQGQSMS